MNYYKEKKYPINIARLFHTFGPGLNLNDGRVFSDFINDAIQGKSIVIKGDPDLVRPLLYIKDATIMFLKILLSEKSGEIYNVANPKNLITVKEMAGYTAESIYKIKAKKISVTLTRENLKHYKGAEKIVKPDINKFIKEFKYIPNTSAKEAFYRTIASFY